MIKKFNIFIRPIILKTTKNSQKVISSRQTNEFIVFSMFLIRVIYVNRFYCQEMQIVTYILYKL